MHTFMGIKLRIFLRRKFDKFGTNNRISSKKTFPFLIYSIIKNNINI